MQATVDPPSRGGELWFSELKGAGGWVCADAARLGGNREFGGAGGYGCARRYRREGMLALPYGVREFYG